MPICRLELWRGPWRWARSCIVFLCTTSALVLIFLTAWRPAAFRCWLVEVPVEAARYQLCRTNPEQALCAVFPLPRPFHGVEHALFPIQKVPEFLGATARSPGFWGLCTNPWLLLQLGVSLSYLETSSR